MSEKLSRILRELEQSVVNLEEKYVAHEINLKTKPSNGLDQRDLFAISNDQNNKKMTAVLDRTINKMEQLVGDSANG